jgi:ribosome-associated protein
MGIVFMRRNEDSLTAKEAVLLAARAANDKKATDILIQDVSELMHVTDYFITVTGGNARQVDGIVDGIEEALLEEAGMKPNFVEGRDSLEWVLLDYGSFVVHVFQPQTRDFYRLESLWGDAPVVDVSEAGIDDPVYSERIARLAGREA